MSGTRRETREGRRAAPAREPRRRGLTNDAPFFGNDFITVNPPRSLEISLKAKF